MKQKYYILALFFLIITPILSLNEENIIAVVGRTDEVELNNLEVDLYFCDFTINSTSIQDVDTTLECFNNGNEIFSTDYTIEDKTAYNNKVRSYYNLFTSQCVNEQWNCWCYAPDVPDFYSQGIYYNFTIDNNLETIQGVIDDFNDGSALDDFYFISGTEAITFEANSSDVIEGTNSLNFTHDNAAAYRKDFTATTNYISYYINMKKHSNSGSRFIRTYLLGDSGPVAGVYFYLDGKIKANNGVLLTYFADYTDDTLYNIKLKMDYDNDNYMVDLNGTLYGPFDMVNPSSYSDGIALNLNTLTYTSMIYDYIAREVEPTDIVDPEACFIEFGNDFAYRYGDYAINMFSYLDTNAGYSVHANIYNDTDDLIYCTEIPLTSYNTQKHIYMNTDFELKDHYVTIELKKDNTTHYLGGTYFSVQELIMPTTYLDPSYYFSETANEDHYVFINENWIIREELRTLYDNGTDIIASDVICSMLIRDYENHEILAEYGHDEQILESTVNPYVRERHLMSNTGGEVIFKTLIGLNWREGTNYTARLRCGDTHKDYNIVVLQSRDYNPFYNIADYLANKPKTTIAIIIVVILFFTLIFFILKKSKLSRRRRRR